MTRAACALGLMLLALSPPLSLGCQRSPGVVAASPGAGPTGSDAPRPGEHLVLESTLYTTPLTPLVGFDTAKTSDVSPDELASIGALAEADFKASYLKPQHTRWFFHAFDATTLTFVLADFDAKDAPPGVLASRGSYVARRRYRCERTPETEAMFAGVKETLLQWEVGVAGVRAGMKLADVVAAKGEPARVEPTQIEGWDHVYYGDVALFVTAGVVRSVRAP